MVFPFKKFALIFIFNICLFTILMVSIQNSAKKSKVNLLVNETIKLPISFIVGVSFISGSIIGTSLPLEK